MIEYDFQRGFPGGISSKDSAANARDARDMGMTLGSGRSPGVGTGIPLRYSGKYHGLGNLSGYNHN